MNESGLNSQRQFTSANAALPAPGVALASPHARRMQRSITLVAVIIPFLGFLAVVALLWGRSVGFLELGLLLLMYVLSVLGIEVGFHRYFSHHAFQAHQAVRVALAILGSMTVQGPVLFWVAIHRRHHAYSDQPGDPHSPHLHGDGLVGTLRGLWHAHVGWLFAFENTDWVRYAPDLLRDPVIFHINRLYPLWVSLGLLLPTVLGGLLTMTWTGALYGLLWGGLARIFLVHHSIWSVNSLCHCFGSRTFQSKDQSTNNVWLAPISLGGSWHNNHHAFPGSARNGFAWWQIDPSGWFIRILELLGLAWDVKAPSSDMIEKAKKRPARVRAA
ncbi:MAG TPA: acyl-CoA desaturase [Pyrinomonadaceae bacterium]|jgi:stearoyl-CoA desaturase (delta-9 desaturase)